MDINAIIINFIQVGVAILGFSGIVIALVSRGGKADDYFKLSFNMILTMPIGLVFLSLLGLVAFNSTLSEATASQIVSCAGLLHIVGLYILRRSKVKRLSLSENAGNPRRSRPIFKKVAVPIRVLAILMIITHALNIFWCKGLLLYLTGLSLLLFFGLIVFTAFLWEVWNDKEK